MRFLSRKHVMVPAANARQESQGRVREGVAPSLKPQIPSQATIAEAAIGADGKICKMIGNGVMSQFEF
jgi:hypothetical protein